jgi:peroxiredoxin
MTEQNGQRQSSKAMWVVPVVVLAIVVGVAATRRVLYAPSQKEVIPQPMPDVNVKAVDSTTQPIIKAQVTIDDVIRVRQSWDPGFMHWVGKQVPDFDLADIDGKSHKLSNYKGKTVMLIFWATWCPPCRQEIPGLIELRKTASSDKLAIMAISFETGDTVRRFLSKNPVNYTVIAAPQNIVPPPFQSVNALPSTFFIDKDGVIRLAAEGLMLEKEVEMILKAIE